MQANIVVAPPEEGWAAAKNMAQAFLCSSPGVRPCGVCENCRKVRQDIHPDVTVIAPLEKKGEKKKEIVVDQVREMTASAAISPSEAEGKVYIIREAGRLNLSAQNALLKLLEDPPPFDAFILIAEAAEQLLETVRSRCAVSFPGGEAQRAPAEARALAEEWIDLAAARARVSLISFANANGDRTAAELLEFAGAARELLTDMLCARLPDRKIPRRELMRLVNLMEKTETYLRSNVSAKHVLGMLSAETIQYEERAR